MFLQQQPGGGVARQPCGHSCMSFTSLSAAELFPKCFCGGAPPHFVLKTLHSLVTPGRGSPAATGVSGARREASQVETRQGGGPGGGRLPGAGPPQTVTLCCQYCPPQQQQQNVYYRVFIPDDATCARDCVWQRPPRWRDTPP